MWCLSSDELIVFCHNPTLCFFYPSEEEGKVFLFLLCR